MENKNEKNYYFIWLYISLLLHLLLVIIMLSIKPSSSLSTEPDPATDNMNDVRIIFVDEPTQPTNNDDDDVIKPFQLAKKIQGSQAGTSQDGLTTPQSIQQKNDDPEKTLDTSSKALTDEHKKGLKDETVIKDQSLADDSVQEKVSAQELLPQSESVTESEQLSDKAIEEYDKNNNDHDIANKPQELIDSIKEFNRFVQDSSPQPKKQNPLSTIIPSKMITTEPAPKIESKKHQLIDIGTENRSKIELTKDVTEKNVQKKTKVSLQDLNLQQGFNDFLKKGNAYFSSEGNSDKDDEQGLKRASYKNQVGKMHESAFLSYPSKYKGTVDNMPMRDSIINMIIERSGKVNLIRLQSSGDQLYDEYHMKVLKFIGDCPPIPKFIESNFQVASILYPGRASSFGSYQPEKLQF